MVLTRSTSPEGLKADDQVLGQFLGFLARDMASHPERKSIAITANAPFSAWDEVFPDKAMTVAAVDRLVHHSTILEMNVGSYRRRAALPARRQRSATPAQ